MPSTEPGTPPTILAQGLAQVNTRLADIPLDKQGALVVAVEWRHGVPTMRFGVAARVGSRLKLGADAEARFQATPNAKVYAAWTW